MSSKDQPEQHIKLDETYKIGGISVVSSLIIGLIVKHFAPDKEKHAAFMTILGLGLLVSAFVPQLYQNYVLKSKATDSVVAIFLIFTTVGVFLRFPALRKQLKQARLSRQNIFITTILCIATCFTVVVHTIWAWQCAIYDSEKAGHNKQVLEVAAPVLSIMVIAGIFWMFFL